MSSSPRRIVFGICAMDKKTTSKPMRQILDRLRAYGDCSVVVFGNALLLDDSIPVSSYPRCDCFLSFHSSGFPHHKAVEYVSLFSPYCINDIAAQTLLWSRPDTYKLLEDARIRTPTHLYAPRGAVVQQLDDHILVDGVRLDFPLVEKPFDGDDHNIIIYYGHGRGARRLFRKVKNRSSEYCEALNTLRSVAAPDAHDGFVYEAFMDGAQDLKVYTIGPYYAHGETRKSPAVDGVVERDPDGKELRLITRLTPDERDLARRVAIAFGQNICGFDIIRHKNESYVIDVNGWSFVKGNLRYYDKAARIIRRLAMGSAQGRRAMALPSAMALPPAPPTAFVDGENHNVLRAMVAVFRHADRTPKQKIKLKTDSAHFLRLFDERQRLDPVDEPLKTEVRITAKSPLLPIFRDALDAALGEPDAAPLLHHVRIILDRGSRGTKVQLKPKALTPDGESVAKALLVCKWGGEVTDAGIAQTLQYAPVFWDTMLRPPPSLSAEPGTEPIDEPGFQTEYTMRASRKPRFHEPRYREQRLAFIRRMKCFAPDEARVRATAKAFIQGSLELDEFPASDAVITDARCQEQLDGIADASREAITDAKEILRELINSDEPCAHLQDKQEVLSEFAAAKVRESHEKLAQPELRLRGFTEGQAATMSQWGIRCLRWLGAPRRTLDKVIELTEALQHQIDGLLDLHDKPPVATQFEPYDSYDDEQDERGEARRYPPDFRMANGETLLLLKERWDAVAKRLRHDTSKIPDLYDYINYDVLHNRPMLSKLRPLWRGARRLTDFVVPHEYGISRREKLYIGNSMTRKLLRQILEHLQQGLRDDAETRAFCSFSCESHLHALRNTILYSGMPSTESVATTLESIELNYLSHGVIRLFEDVSLPHDDPQRFYVNVQFSPGAALDPFTFAQPDGVLPVSRPVPIHGRLSFEDFRQLISEQLS